MLTWPGPGVASGRSSTLRSLAVWMTTDFMALSRLTTLRSYPLERHRDTLADADAHRRQCPPLAAEAELERCRPGDPRATHPERMPERNRPAIGIDVRRVVGNPELAQHRERLAGEGLVKLH